MSARVTIVARSYPVLVEVCELMDLQIRSDLFHRDTIDCDEETECPPEHFVTKYYLHDNDDPSVGIRGAQFSPEFLNLTYLHAWCQLRIKSIQFMSAYADKAMVDAIDYDSWWAAWEEIVAG